MSIVRALLMFALVAACACTSTHLRVSWIHPSPMVVAERWRPVYVDERFDEADRTTILAAIEEWNAALNGRLLLVPQPWDLDAVAGDPNAIAIYWTTDKIAPRPSLLDPQAIGWTDQTGGRFVWAIRDRIPDAHLRPFTLHELGHVLGAEHTDSGLMRAALDPKACIDLGAIEQVARHLKVPTYALAWCEVTT